jgi:hypothetical protein
MEKMYMKFYKSSPLRLCACLALVFASMFFGSCAEPSPLYGSWADNRGSSISFFDDGTFSAKILLDAFGSSALYGGDFSVQLNAMTFKTENPDGTNLQVVTEWDIRGNMLYITWPEAFPLTLYKVSN